MMTVVDESGIQEKSLARAPMLLAGVTDSGEVALCYTSANAPASPLSVKFEGEQAIPLRSRARLLCGIDDNGNVVPLRL
jgi:hypothetical protein